MFRKLFAVIPASSILPLVAMAFVFITLAGMGISVLVYLSKMSNH